MSKFEFFDAEGLAHRLGGKKARRVGANWMTLCPLHETVSSTPSLSVADGDNGCTVVTCHGGCSREGVLAKLREMGIALSNGGASTSHNGKCKRSIVESYSYTDEVVKSLFEVVRYKPKAFAQRTPDPSAPGGWHWSVKGIRPVPFNLPAVIKAIADGRPIFVVEGEKDALALAKLGIVATTNAGGAGKWKPELSQFFRGADLVLIPDNDESDTGWLHMKDVATQLSDVKKRMRMLTLPAKDVSDWLRAGGTPEQLWELAEQAPEWKPDNDKKPTDEKSEAPIGSDEALALRFADRHKNTLRHTAVWNKWHVYNGRVWNDDSTLQAFNYARAICREAATAEEMPSGKRELASAKKRASVVSLAREDRGIAATPEQWDSDALLLNTPEGVIDLCTFKMRPHRATDYLTKMTAAAPGGTCPLWLQFLDKITGGDVALQEFLQRVAGYSLTGDISEHALFFGFGTGGNGKGVFQRTIAGILADYHRAAPIATFTENNFSQHPTELAMLKGARLVTASETQQGRRWDESRIKMLTGGDPVPARFMRQDFFEYTPQFKLFITGNHKPRLRSVDEAIRRRFHLVPFLVTIPKEERDRYLADKLKTEWAGILQWMLDGCADWRERGLAPPEAVVKATDAYLEAEDALGEWLEECCHQNPNVTDTTKRLFASWTAWAGTASEHIGTQRAFSDRLEEHGFKRARTEKIRGFIGLKVLG